MIKNTRVKRKELIKKIEDMRKSRLIVYLTGDRPSVGVRERNLLFTKVAVDVLTILNNHLKKIGETHKIDLFLYTTGGGLEAPWPIVNLIRSYCKHFSVLVPFKALSAGTLIALGADEIVMTRLALLSPVDPTRHLPPPEIAPKLPKEVSVEDVIGFINLAKEKVRITQQEGVEEILKLLVTDIQPLTLGSVNRIHAHIRDLATKLLRLHISEELKGASERIDKIVKYLTEQLHSHDHLINRHEARATIELQVTNSEDITDGDNLDNLMNDLYNLYSKEMQLEEPFNPYLFIEDKSEKTDFFKRAFIETTDYTHIFESEFRVFSTKEGIRTEEKKSGWELKEGD